MSALTSGYAMGTHGPRMQHYLADAQPVLERAPTYSQVASHVARVNLTPSASKVVIVMVGLPARGKSFISMRICHFYAWLGTKAQIFNVGEHRRTAETAVQDASYFDPNDAERQKSRDKLAFETLDRLLDWLDGQTLAVAIFDATNSTVKRRRRVFDHIRQHNASYGVVFVESCCADSTIVEANIHAKISKSPDYKNIPYETARSDFLARMEHYQSAFEPLGTVGAEEKDLSYIKLLDLGMQFTAHKVYGHITATLLPYLQAIHIGKRPIWLIRLPESQITAQGRGESPSGRDVPLDVSYSDETMSNAGRLFAEKLAAHVHRSCEMASLHAFICTHRRALECAERLDDSQANVTILSSLSPMDWGSYNGIRRADFETDTSPDFFAKLQRDPMNTRFPGGESYGDFVRRLMPVIIEIEQECRPVVVIAPLSVLQVLHCYFANFPITAAPEVVIPQHAIMEWRPAGVRFASRVISESELN
uniref:6-phosphofructo-2-kinase domain-containing protein n=1 Tax=Pyrodinium bahamense TaxID=73915 RepID=A0A7S0AHA0_9DINO|mmetsp:Transcript_33958/g.93994  ORF Transcript_33958/g.93994 Transcript_33958/m.93994 type:complete len:478 (+) Transcript_33958:41-1474(+)